MDNFPFYYEAFTSAGTLILFILVARRISQPFECQCGYRTMFARRMFRHLQQAHKYKELTP
jgi:hypothetical protein